MRTVNELIMNITGGSSSAHAYIIEGSPASAREEFIGRLSMGLECLNSDISLRPCGQCSACRQVRAGTSMDIVRMEKSGKTSYQVKDADAFTERLAMGAYGRFLVGIIDDAESLSEVVQNKLLKTLEEPQSRALLLLGVSNRDSLLSTVRSRCGILRLQEFEGFDDSSDEENSEELSRAAELALNPEAAFFEFREKADKAVKTKSDARRLIDLIEDGLRERMYKGEDALSCAERIELCEMTRTDIERDMDKSKALKRLYLELRQKHRR